MSALALASSGNARRDLDHDGTDSDRDFQLDSGVGGPGLWRVPHSGSESPDRDSPQSVTTPSVLPFDFFLHVGASTSQEEASGV